MSNLFNGASPLGGQSQQSSSSNQAFGQLSSGLGGNVTNGAGADSQIANMLGLNGNAAQSQGFNNWKNSTGYQFGLNQGMQSINGSAATQGLLNSGGNEKAIQTYGQNYANTQYGNYMNQLQGLLTGGNQSGSVISSAGNTQQSTGGTSPGMGSFGQLINKLPQMAAAGA